MQNTRNNMSEYTNSKEYQNYIKTGMCPVVGVCAHGPDAETIAKSAHRQMVEHGFSAINIPAGPVDDDGKNIKQLCKEPDSVEAVPVENEVVMEEMKTKKKNIKKVKVTTSITNKKANEEYEQRFAKLEQQVQQLQKTLNQVQLELQNFL